ncbi:uncharacterized protein LOC113229549 [Hyposmocoma kahamanoa]|uniref:uncharacterized protein LOC113229549 n=1 Tax=Hyposmocoma kahamanoa TaxID=1477025 RepID=UPI000E6D74C9|nr:uncharacterized protein LOC113229549 [Hyposmocoma kahamanoa]XP_026318970.1 uncharacterized protein LOC113229549 [Hyposmocoma kahamanoa]
MKLLYLYDPEACQQVYFYNYTVLLRDSLSLKSVQWIVKNECATSFRGKIKIWMVLHILWLFFCLLNKAQGTRAYGFYASLLPFTACGIALLVYDLVLVALFLSDTSKTGTEGDIIKYIDDYGGKVGSINKTNVDKPFASFFLPDVETGVDTSWISLLFAYASCRGIVQWVINFWIVVDNYYQGLSINRKLNAKKDGDGGRSSVLSL